MKVLKFGGSSVKDADCIKNVASIVQDKLAQDPACIVVVSALGGITDHLINLAKAAVDNQFKASQLEELKARHLDCLKDLEIESTETNEKINSLINELEDRYKSIANLGELTNKTLDSIATTGELLSSLIINQAFIKHGLSSQQIDARQLITTDSTFGSAKVNFEKTEQDITKKLQSLNGVAVIPGFIAADQNETTTSLGRGGSDYTAGIIGATLNVEEIEIWTDVDGLYTADPRHVKKAFPQPAVSFAEAMELSHFGAKVIYPPAIQPALSKNIPIRIKNSFHPTAAGTIITQESAQSEYPICGISLVPEICFCRLEGTGLKGVAGTAKRLFSSLAFGDINIILITQASSEHTICFAIKPEEEQKAIELVNQEFELEIQSKLINPLITESDLSIVSVVGENMIHTPGIAGNTFSSLGENGVNIVAIAQGSSELNISAVIKKSQAIIALKALHEEFFFPDTKHINLMLIGTGLIGSELVDQLKAHSAALETHHDHFIRLIAIANSKRMHFDPEGIDVHKALELLEGSDTDSDIEELIKQAKKNNFPNTIIADCTASDFVANQYSKILKNNISIVTPNKRAQSADFAQYQELKRISKKRHCNFLYETSVGAGLPVISTIDDLLKSGDKIVKIEAVLSGTLSYIFNNFNSSIQFSDIVKQAKELGYTEPDPREDLNGKDVARKILILARESGLELEFDDLEIENLVPEDCRETKDIAEFFDKLEEHDQYFKDKTAAAEDKNSKLCYIASLENDKAKVRLAEVDAAHPFYSLQGSDNIIALTTRRYPEWPLVIKGAGAGAGVTAAGVFADIIRLAN